MTAIGFIKRALLAFALIMAGYLGMCWLAFRNVQS
jgi:hypothetical protein